MNNICFRLCLNCVCVRRHELFDPLEIEDTVNTIQLIALDNNILYDQKFHKDQIWILLFSFFNFSQIYFYNI